jgi:hypothetical protein
MSERLAGLDAVIGLKLLDVRLTLADLYSGLVFRPGPGLAEPDDDLSAKRGI